MKTNENILMSQLEQNKNERLANEIVLEASKKKLANQFKGIAGELKELEAEASQPKKKSFWKRLFRK